MVSFKRQQLVSRSRQLTRVILRFRSARFAALLAALITLAVGACKGAPEAVAEATQAAAIAEGRPSENARDVGSSGRSWDGKQGGGANYAPDPPRPASDAANAGEGGGGPGLALTPPAWEVKPPTDSKNRIVADRCATAINRAIGEPAPPLDESLPELPKTARERIAHLLVIPLSTADRRAIFGGTKRLSAGAAKRNKKLSSDFVRECENLLLSAESGHDVLADAVTLAKARDFVKKTKARIISFIGHNDHGMFKFVDGSKIEIHLLAAEVRAAGKIPVFISCNSIEYVGKDGLGFGRELTYDQAVGAARRLEARLDAFSGPLSWKGLESEVWQSLHREGENPGKSCHSVFFLAIGAGAATMTVAILVQLDGQGRDESDDDDDVASTDETTG